MNGDLSIIPRKESERIINFLKQTFQKQSTDKAVIGLSGGIDSTTSLFLLSKTLMPENIFVLHLSYFEAKKASIQAITKAAGIPDANVAFRSITKAADTLIEQLEASERVRAGNIMARVRMIYLYDLAKKQNAFVCGTENKSEFHLGYFTRFGDEASDIEPIRHLYKTQVYELAKYLNVPKQAIEQKPTAGLWENQTDEGEFGFSYKEADQVLLLHFDKGVAEEELIKRGFQNAKAILARCQKNDYKHRVPYSL